MRRGSFLALAALASRPAVASYGGGTYDTFDLTPQSPPPPSPPPLAPWPPGVVCEHSCANGFEDYCDDFEPFAVAACAVGTDCSDCGPRSVCTSCPPACRDRGLRLGRASYCWEHQFTGGECVAACNNWECGYPACSRAQKIEQCVKEQSGLTRAALVSPPANLTAGGEVAGSIADGAAAAVEVALAIDQITINFDSNINSMRARLEFRVRFKWRDSRLRTMPCRELLAEMFTATTATTDAERALIDPYKQVVWWPQLLVQGDSVDFRKASTVKLVTSSVKTHAAAAINWTEPALALPPDGGALCIDCIEQNLSLTHEYALPLWEYSAFPFDSHNITLLLGVPGAHLFNCHLLLGTSVDQSKLLPTTGEWGFVDGNPIATVHPRLQSGAVDLSQCELRMTVKRNSIVFLIKQVVTSILVVYAGLCAPFLDAEDHTGDRVALILVSALIVVVSFQADFGLGKISYLMWFDYFNLTQMGVLALALIETLVEHRAAIGQWPEAQRVALSKVGTPALLLGAYPLTLASVFLYGAGDTTAALVLFGVGAVCLVAACVLSYRRLVRRAEQGASKLIRKLQRTPVVSEEFVPLLRQLYRLYDAEGNNMLSVDAVRRMMRQVLKHASAAEYARILERAMGSSGADISFEALRDAIELYKEELTKRSPRAEEGAGARGRRPSMTSHCPASRISHMLATALPAARKRGHAEATSRVSPAPASLPLHH
ncbi:hypothetical protein AB1Y20_014103 [Prymnesium parvum]|uniref:EF-hand domain-containing protein n=1 Tax=Prymnesium parvum TaxID=97485 RepID=A0AB34IHG4_PRYPA